MTLTPQDELSRFYEQSTASFAEKIAHCSRSLIDGRMSEEKALSSLGKRVAETMTLAHLFGARRVLLEVDAATGGRKWSREAEEGQPAKFAADIIPRVPFMEAVDDLLGREPRLGQTWREVADLYQTGPAFAAVRSANLQVTRKLRDTISRLQKEGAPVDTASGVIAEMADWGRAYAETVFRTNASTAYSNGRQEEARRPLVRREMPGRMRFSAQDRDVRHNHAAAHGLIADTEDPIWNHQVSGGPAMPPSGYNCRCSDQLLTRSQLSDMGLLLKDGSVRRKLPESWPSYHPDPGFERKFAR